MKNTVEIVHLKWHVWYKTQSYPPHGKKTNPHFRVFYNSEEAIDFFNKEPSAFKIEASCDIRNPGYMYGNGDAKTIFEKDKKLKP